MKQDRRSDLQRLVGLGVFALAFIVYARTVCRTLTLGDGPELAAASYTLGICHPTGYPTFTLLGFLWSHLPIPGSPMFRLNLLASVEIASAAVVFYKLLLLLLQRLPWRAATEGGDERSSSGVEIGFAAAGALAFAFARTVWDQAIGYEVYALQALLFSTWLYLCLKAYFFPEQSRRFLLWAAFALGVCFSNHLTSIWLLPAFLYLFLKTQKATEGKWRLFWKMAGLAAIPMVMYLYLPMRSSSSFLFSGLPKPALDSGATGYGWNFFFDHITGVGFRNLMFHAKVNQQVGFFGRLLPFELGIVGLIPLVTGVIYLYRRQRSLLWFFAWISLVTLFIAVNYDIFDIDSYFLPCFITLIVMAMVGVLNFARANPKLLGTAWIIAGIALVSNYHNEDHSTDTYAIEYAKMYLDNLEPNAVVLTNRWFTLVSACRYLQTVDHYRPDVVVLMSGDLRVVPAAVYEDVRRYPDVFAKSAAEVQALENTPVSNQDVRRYAWLALMRSLIVNNVDGPRPLYYGPDLRSSNPGLASGFQLVPVGMCLRVLPPDAPPLNFEVRADPRRMLASEFDPEDQLQTEVLLFSSFMLKETAAYQMQVGKAAEAERLAKMSAQVLAKIPPEVFKAVREAHEKQGTP